jgi:hypothetical protein
MMNTLLLTSCRSTERERSASFHRHHVVALGVQSNIDCMAMVFAHEAQSSLAHTLYKMKTRRARLLDLTNGVRPS